MQKIAVFWAVAIGVAWFVIAMSTLVTRDYTGLVIITPLMLLCTGVVLGVRPSLKDLNGKNGGDK